MRILHELPEAQLFLGNWKQLLEVEESVTASISTANQEFQETPTRNAFTTLSVKLHDIQKLALDTHNVLSRRTESFSPSKRIKTSVPLQPLPTSSPGASSSSQPMQLNTSYDNRRTFSPPSTPVAISRETSLAPNVTSSPLRNPQNGNPQILPVIFQKMGKVYHVLRLTPPNPALDNLILHDPILPSPTAFRDAQFPSFYNSTWQHIFEKVTHPVAMWEVYAPRNLGDYHDVRDLWQAWDEGSFVEGVGRLPALRLIEARWGTLKNKETNKGKYAQWRPPKDDKVSIYK